jgi:hypothetical protein
VDLEGFTKSLIILSWKVLQADHVIHHYMTAAASIKFWTCLKNADDFVLIGKN